MAHNPDNVITVDRMELADEMAVYIMDQKYPEGWMENEIPLDERSTLRPKAEVEQEYGDYYVDAETLIENCEVRNSLNVDWESLQVQKKMITVWRKTMDEDDLNRQHLSGIIHLIGNLQDQFEPKPEE